MSRFLILSIIVISLTACSPAATATPIELTTATPAPTNTPTPTLEPWMQSLPESVATVEIDGDKIFGLDAAQNLTAVFDLDSATWLELPQLPKIDASGESEAIGEISVEIGALGDVNVVFDNEVLYKLDWDSGEWITSGEFMSDYIAERTAYYEDDFSMAWGEIVEKLVLGNENFDKIHNAAGKYPELPHFHFSNMGFALNVSDVEVNNASWRDMGITKETVAEVAFPGSTGVALVLCGVDVNGDYHNFCSPPFPYGLKSRDYDPYDFESQFIYAELVDFLGNNQETLDKGWSDLENGDFSEGSQEYRSQQVYIKRLDGDWDLWKTLVSDPDGPVSSVSDFRKDYERAVRLGEAEKLEWVTTEVMAAYHMWLREKMGNNNPVLIPMAIRHFD